MIDKEYKIYISTSQRIMGGKPYPGEEGPYATCEPTYREVSFHKAYTTQPQHMMFFESVQLSEQEYIHLSKKKNVYLAVVFYSDGDTFGTSHGLFQISGISATVAGAKKLNKKALEEDAYKPWEGYFARLDRADVFLLDLEK